MYGRPSGINSSRKAPGRARLSKKQVSTFLPGSPIALGGGRGGDLRAFQRKKEEKNSLHVPLTPYSLTMRDDCQAEGSKVQRVTLLLTVRTSVALDAESRQDTERAVRISRHTVIVTWVFFHIC